MDDQLPLNEHQRQLLNRANGRILYFYLSGPMIFGISKALARERANTPNHDVVIIDLSDVPLLDDTMSLSTENLIDESRDMGKTVIVIVKTQNGKQPFLRLLQQGSEVREEIAVNDRADALEMGLRKVNTRSNGLEKVAYAA